MKTAKFADRAVKEFKDAQGSARAVGSKIHQRVAGLLGEAKGEASKLSDLASSYFKGSNGALGKKTDLSWAGTNLWADLTTKGQWKQHVKDYEQQFGDGA